MMKIMIVDDMPIFREYLRNYINWKNYGFTICCEAVDGKDALEKIEEFWPDIVLTDITMPYINGIELSNILKDKYKDISTIIITGHDEFEYAQAAIRIGVNDFIVKPFEKEELIIAILKIKDNINVSLETPIYETNVRKDQLLQNLMIGNEKADYEKLMAIFPYSYFRFYILSLQTVNAEYDKIYQWNTIIMNMLGDKVESPIICRKFHDYENNFIVMLNFRTSIEAECAEIFEMNDFVKMIKKQLNLTIDYAYSDVFDKLGGFEEEYQKEKEILYARKTEDNVEIVKEVIDLQSSIKKVHDGLKGLEEQSIYNEIDLKWNMLMASDNVGQTQYFLSSLVSILLVNVINAGRNVEDIFGENFMPYVALDSVSDIIERKNLVISYYKERIAFEKLNRNQNGEIVDKAISYIQKNLASHELCVPDIAKYLLLNQTYLRKMFKERMGITISAYITKERMEKAKYRIMTEKISIQKIAEELGYSDVGYFSKCYKKHFGIAPKYNKGGV